MILDWNEFYDNAAKELMAKFPQVKSVVINTPIEDGPTKHIIMIDVYYAGQVSKKNINRFFSELSEKLAGSAYRGEVYRRDKGKEVEFDGRLEPRLSVSILPYEEIMEPANQGEAEEVETT